MGLLQWTLTFSSKRDMRQSFGFPVSWDWTYLHLAIKIFGVKCLDTDISSVHILQSSSKLLGRLLLLTSFFLSTPSPPPPPTLPHDERKVYVCACNNCSVISQHWIGGTLGVFSKRENSLFYKWKWTTVKLHNLPNLTFVWDCSCHTCRVRTLLSDLLNTHSV